MVSPSTEPLRLWPAILAYQAFNQTYGIWIVGLLAFVLMTAKLHDNRAKKNDHKIGFADFSDNGVQPTFNSQVTQQSIGEDESTSSGKSVNRIDSEKMKYFEFFFVLRSKGFNLMRIKEKKTSMKCVRLNSNNELSWSKKYHFSLGSCSSEFRLDNLMSTFLCESDNSNSKTSQFIVQFRSKVLCFAAATRDASHIVNCLEGLRISLETDPLTYSLLNEYYKRRTSGTHQSCSTPGNFLKDDASVQTITTTSSFDRDSSLYKDLYRSHPFSLHRRHEAITVQPIY